jgi:hypothetical protein
MPAAQRPSKRPADSYARPHNSADLSPPPPFEFKSHLLVYKLSLFIVRDLDMDHMFFMMRSRTETSSMSTLKYMLPGCTFRSPQHDLDLDHVPPPNNLKG